MTPFTPPNWTPCPALRGDRFGFLREILGTLCGRRYRASPDSNRGKAANFVRAPLEPSERLGLTISGSVGATRYIREGETLIAATAARSSAAGVGFEPTERLTTLNGFQDRPVRPLRHPAVSRA